MWLPLSLCIKLGNMHMYFQTQQKYAATGSYQSFNISFCITPLLGTEDHYFQRLGFFPQSEGNNIPPISWSNGRPSVIMNCFYFSSSVKSGFRVHLPPWKLQYAYRHLGDEGNFRPERPAFCPLYMQLFLPQILDS